MERNPGPLASLPVKPTPVAALAAAAVVGVISVGGVLAAQPAAPDSCDEYGSLASAGGIYLNQAAPGVLLSEETASLPGAQAQADSVLGSNGWAGAPYSVTAAENVGLAGRAVEGVGANSVPVFAVSSYPSQPEAGSSSPAVTVESKSGPRSASAQVIGGGPTTAQASAGRLTTAAIASCGDDGAVKATGDSVVEMVDVAGVLRIGRVRSHAQAVVDGTTAKRTLAGTMTVEGATVMGQSVAITEQGVVVGSPAAPNPDNPLSEALAEAGITVRYIASAKDESQGQVVSPGLEIVMVRETGIGTGPPTTRFVLGRAYARASGSSAAATDAGLGLETSELAPSVADAAPSHGGPTLSGATSPLLPSLRSLQPGEPRDLAESADPRLIANASVGGVYAALAFGLVLAAVWLLTARLGVRLRWR